MGSLCGGGQERWWAEPRVGAVHVEQMTRPHGALLMLLEGLSVRAEFLVSAAGVRGLSPELGSLLSLKIC